MVKQKDKTLPIGQDATNIGRELILYNDEINTFDVVIQALIEVCNHEPEQAEQCAIVAHFKGKCIVKTGDYIEIKPLYDEMTLRGLTVSVE